MARIGDWWPFITAMVLEVMFIANDAPWWLWAPTVIASAMALQFVDGFLDALAKY